MSDSMYNGLKTTQICICVDYGPMTKVVCIIPSNTTLKGIYSVIPSICKVHEYGGDDSTCTLYVHLEHFYDIKSFMILSSGCITFLDKD